MVQLMFFGLCLAGTRIPCGVGFTSHVHHQIMSLDAGDASPASICFGARVSILSRISSEYSMEVTGTFSIRACN